MPETFAEQLQIYTSAGVTFASAFFPKESYAGEYKDLHGDLRVDPVVQQRLESMYTDLLDELLQPERIRNLIMDHRSLAIKLFHQFRSVAVGDASPEDANANADLVREIEDTCAKSGDRLILKTFVTFNSSILMTNFFKHGNREAVSFRLNPKVVFLGKSKVQYPETPYAVYLIQGRDFAGFHTRMRDVARGGLRLVLSRDKAGYDRNARTLYDEGYNLALTQQRKNKDIPEGGAKGVMLPRIGADHKTTFTSYVNALLDCMMPEKNGIFAGHMKGRPENLFFGPDENTADYMDMGAELARSRGYPLWKALTTGKSVKLGGIPHDTHGMTTAGVHRFVVELLAALGEDESKITKCQTGGPDGDLGSNEILCSKDITISIVDGSGVVYDPSGLNRSELVRLAKNRLTVNKFNRSLLGGGAFLVTVDDKAVTLPDGSHWQTGAQLRDVFHLTDFFTADLFVPCGGRPKAVNLENVQKLFDPRTKKAKFRFIVEGANLFFTDPARAVMERAGCHVFKDASTNKGGVTSSSLEVFAGLAFADQEHSSVMTYNPDQGGVASEFYNTYVQQILDVIHENARLEFHAIWEANQKQGIAKIEATRLLSLEITEMQDVFIENIGGMNEKEKADLLWTVLPRALPDCVVQRLGVEGIKENVPENYLWAIVGAWIGSRYVYEHGINSTKVSFFFFMRRLQCISVISAAIREWGRKIRANPSLKRKQGSRPHSVGEPLAEPSPQKDYCGIQPTKPVSPNQGKPRPPPVNCNAWKEPIKPNAGSDEILPQGSGLKAVAGLKQNTGAASLLGEHSPTKRHNAFTSKANRQMRTTCGTLVA